MACSRCRCSPTHAAHARVQRRRAWRSTLALALCLVRSVGVLLGLGGRDAAVMTCYPRRSHGYYVKRAKAAGLHGLYEPREIFPDTGRRGRELL